MHCFPWSSKDATAVHLSFCVTSEYVIAERNKPTGTGFSVRSGNAGRLDRAFDKLKAVQKR